MKKCIFILAVIFLLAGCALLPQRPQKAQGNAYLEPQAVLKFGDVPVPAGFKFLAADSYAFESSGVRTGVLRYQGVANPEEVINFYREQMPMYNWRLLNVIEYGERLINFDRENETCIVSLSAKKNLLRNSISRITISVGPKPRMPKNQDKPIK